MHIARANESTKDLITRPRRDCRDCRGSVNISCIARNCPFICQNAFTSLNLALPPTPDCHPRTFTLSEREHLQGEAIVRITWFVFTYIRIRVFPFSRSSTLLRKIGGNGTWKVICFNVTKAPLLYAFLNTREEGIFSFFFFTNG